MAYADGVVYVPTIDLATFWTPNAFDRTRFDVHRATGHLTAIDVNSGRALWVHEFQYAALGAAPVVNDLVFTGTYDGTIYALNRTPGEVVWSYKAPAGINGWPAVSGDTIVWPCGAANTIGTNWFGTPAVIDLKLGAAPPPSPSASPITSPVPSASPTPSASPLVTPSPSNVVSPVPTATP